MNLKATLTQFPRQRCAGRMKESFWGNLVRRKTCSTAPYINPVYWLNQATHEPVQKTKVNMTFFPRAKGSLAHPFHLVYTARKVSDRLTQQIYPNGLFESIPEEFIIPNAASIASFHAYGPRLWKPLSGFPAEKGFSGVSSWFLLQQIPKYFVVLAPFFTFLIYFLFPLSQVLRFRKKNKTFALLSLCKDRISSPIR